MDLARFVERIRRSGGALVATPTIGAAGTSVAVAEDPQGAIFALAELDPDAGE